MCFFYLYSNDVNVSFVCFVYDVSNYGDVLFHSLCRIWFLHLSKSHFWHLYSYPLCTKIKSTYNELYFSWFIIWIFLWQRTHIHIYFCHLTSTRPLSHLRHWLSCYMPIHLMSIYYHFTYKQPWLNYTYPVTIADPTTCTLLTSTAAIGTPSVTSLRDWSYIPVFYRWISVTCRHMIIITYSLTQIEYKNTLIHYNQQVYILCLYLRNTALPYYCEKIGLI